MRDKLLKYLGYPLFFVVCLTFFLVQGFPVHLVAAQLQNRARAAGVKLDYDDLAVAFPNGLRASSLRISAPRAEGGSYGLRVDEAAARISLLGLLTGKRHLSFELNLLAGNVQGSLDLVDGLAQIRVRLAGIKLDKVPFWQELLGLQLRGELGGEIDLDWHPAKVKESTGKVSLELLGGALGKGKVYGIELPWLDLGKTSLLLNLAKGKADIKTAKAQSDELEAGLEGYLLLQQRLANTSMHCRLRFKPSASVLDKIRAKIPPEFHTMLDNELNRARGSDGFFRYSIFGRIFSGRPSFRPIRQ